MLRLAQYAGAAKKLVSDNSPAILTAVAVVGVVSTAILAVKAAPKAHQDILNQESEQRDPMVLSDKFLLTYRYFIPTVAVGTATIACVIGANTISTKRQAALAGAYGLTELAFKEYREHVVEDVGAKKEERIHDDVMKSVVARNPISPDNQVIITGSGSSLFLDKFSMRYFEGDMETVRRAVNDVNEQRHNEMYASLNDFYRRIGLASSAVGEEMGWTLDQKLEIRYSSQLSSDGRPCVTLDFDKMPVRDYNKLSR